MKDDAIRRWLFSGSQTKDRFLDKDDVLRDLIGSDADKLDALLKRLTKSRKQADDGAPDVTALLRSLGQAIDGGDQQGAVALLGQLSDVVEGMADPHTMSATGHTPLPRKALRNTEPLFPDAKHIRIRKGR